MQRLPAARIYNGPSLLLIILILLVVLGVVIFGGFYTITATNVTLAVNGARSVVHTHQTTVRALLNEAGVYIEPQDTVSPGLDIPIQNSMIVTIDKAHAVILNVNGQQQRILTHKTDPRAILSENNIAVGQYDALNVENADDIILTRAAAFTLTADGQMRTLYSTARTVGAALADAGIVLYVADKVTPDLSAPLADQMTISIQRAVPITIQVDGRTLATRTHGATVGAALTDAGVALVGLDNSQPASDTPLTANITIRVIRVTEAEEIERTELPFKRITQTDPTLELDTQSVIQAGKAGVQEVHVRVRREDGVEVSRSAPLMWITQPPQDEIDAIGVRIVLHTLSTPDGTIEYWRVLHMRAVSYKPASTGKDSRDPTYGITASGQLLHKGIVAVDPAVIPLGATLYIPNYGKATAGDTGGGVRDNLIDLGYSDDDYQEWSGPVDVYLLTPVPGTSPTAVPTRPTSKNGGVQ